MVLNELNYNYFNFLIPMFHKVNAYLSAVSLITTSVERPAP